MQPDPRTCDRCPKPSAGVCCSSHGKELCHEDYRLTHFVEVCGCRSCEVEGLPKILKRSQPKPAQTPARTTPDPTAPARTRTFHYRTVGAGPAYGAVFPTGHAIIFHPHRGLMAGTTLDAAIGLDRVPETPLIWDDEEAAARLAAYERLETAARDWRDQLRRGGEVMVFGRVVGVQSRALIAAIDALPAPEVTP